MFRFAMIALIVLVTSLQSVRSEGNEGDAKACLEEINVRREKSGLKPYIFDQRLADGALLCAKWRAERLHFDHCSGRMGDWGVAPDMLNYAKYGGCAAYPPKDGFLACAMYEKDCRYCGAVRIRGRDGKDYCHLFCR